MTPELLHPDDAAETEIEVAVPAGSTRFRVRDPPPEVDHLLHEELAYFMDGAEWSAAYDNGQWDGYVRLYDKTDHTAPVGLLDRATSVLESRGYSVTVTEPGRFSADSINVAWNFGHDLRDYQRRAVESTLSAGGGIVSIPTGGGKTVVALKIVELAAKRSIVFVHTKELLRQWADEVRDVLGVDPGVIGDGEWSEGPVTVASMQTLASRGTDGLSNYGVAVYDECHSTSAADTMHDIGLAVDAGLRVGLSATPWRDVDGEELKIEGAVGGLAAEVSAEELIDAGHLARPEFRLIDPADYGDPETPDPLADYQDAYRQCVELAEVRNLAVADTAAELADDGYSVLVSVDRLAQGHLLRFALDGSMTRRNLLDALRDPDDDPVDVAEKVAAAEAAEKVGDHSVAFLSGDDDTATRTDVLDAFDRGEVDILVSTLLKEGVDLPSINAVLLAEAGKSDTAKIQTVGRALRPSNGDHAVVADIRDRGEYLGEHFDVRRQAFADYYGEYGPEVDR